MAAIGDVNKVAVGSHLTTSCRIVSPVKVDGQRTQRLNAAQRRRFAVDCEYANAVSRFVADIGPAVGWVQSYVSRMILCRCGSERRIAGSQPPSFAVK